MACYQTFRTLVVPSLLTCFLLTTIGAASPAGSWSQEASTKENPKAAPIDLEGEAWAKTVQDWAQPLVDDGLVTGLSIGIYSNGKQWWGGFGLADVEQKTAPTKETIFEIGSISKVFTGVLLADAAARKVINLGDPIAAHLPKNILLHERKKPVVWADLSNHTSGFHRMPLKFAPANPTDPYADFDGTKLLENLNGYRPQREPGKRYAYSNYAVGTLGYLLGSVQESNYETLLAQRITGPLGMKRTFINFPKSIDVPIAKPYGSDLAPNAYWSFQAFAGAGGIRSNVTDMLLFAKAALKPGEGELGKALLLSMKITHKDSNGTAVGLGWHRNKRGEFWHNGQTGGFHSYMSISPKDQHAVVVLCNSAVDLVDPLGINLMAELRGLPTTPWKYAKVATVSRELLTALVGTYNMAPEVDMSITLTEAGLFAQLTGQGPLRLFPSSQDEFFLRAVEAKVIFERDSNGRGKALVLHQNGMKNRAERKD